MAAFPDTLLDESAGRGARVVALALAADLAAARDRLAGNRDPSALHDFRVALRRLRSWLRALRAEVEESRPRPAVRRLRRVAKASNAGRDAEVFVEWLREAEPRLELLGQGAAQWMATRFARQQAEAEHVLAEVLSKDFDRAREQLSERLSTYRAVLHVDGGTKDAALATVMAELVRKAAESLLASLPRVTARRRADDVHRARIAGKRLRYLLEPVAPHLEGGDALIERLKTLQDTLGDMHDAHLWLLILRAVEGERTPPPGRATARRPTAARGAGAGDEVRPTRAGFAQLARAARRHAAGGYDRFRREWSPGRAKRFFRDVERVAAALAARGRRGVEIERKYLLRGMPAGLPAAAVQEMAQGYLPGERLVERLREVRNNGERRCYRTVKAGRGVSRLEVEEETPPSAFDVMWPLTKGRRLTKRRHRVPAGALTWEIDEFTDRDLVLAEIELPREDAAVRFPEWLAPYVEREVTGDPAYLNSALAR
jgi:CHAD domain-containing protein/CYTH domain-containing protein